MTLRLLENSQLQQVLAHVHQVQHLSLLVKTQQQVVIMLLQRETPQMQQEQTALHQDVKHLQQAQELSQQGRKLLLLVMQLLMVIKQTQLADGLLLSVTNLKQPQQTHQLLVIVQMYQLKMEPLSAHTVRLPQ